MTIKVLQKAKRDLVNELMACDEASEVDRPWYQEVVRCVVGAGWRPVATRGVADIAEVMADHWPDMVFGCDCTPVDDDGQKGFLAGSWEDHVADLLTQGGTA